MQLWRGIDDVPAELGTCVLTIGNFDGVHCGHQLLVTQTIRTSRKLGLPAVVLTFDAHSAAVLYPHQQPAMLTNVNRRVELLADLGVDAVLLMPFTTQLAAMNPEDFVRHIIVGRLHARHVLVGRNFRFGHRAAGSVDTLQDLGRRLMFSTVAVDLATTDARGGAVISSTGTRSMIAAGSVSSAAGALGRPHRIEGRTVHSDLRSGERGDYHIVEVATEPKVAIPADGTYAGWWHTGGRRLPATILVDSAAAPPQGTAAVQVFLPQDTMIASGRRVAIDFIDQIRPAGKSEVGHHRPAMIDDDLAQSRTLLGISEPTPTSPSDGAPDGPHHGRRHTPGGHLRTMARTR